MGVIFMLSVVLNYIFIFLDYIFLIDCFCDFIFQYYVAITLALFALLIC